MDVSAAVTAIAASTTPAIAVGVAVIVALAGVWAFKLIKKVM